MRKTLAKKLRSNRGMALILALLLFLICAAVGGVALTAGTASSGTISERTQFDQRYFSVTSAAELLRKTFDGETVKVTVERDGNALKIPEPPTADSPEKKFVRVQSLYQLQAPINNFITQYNENKPDDEKLHLEESAGAIIADAVASAGETLGQYELTARNKDDGATYEQLKVSVTIAPEGSGLAFKLKSADEKFRLKMEYTASVKEEIRTDVILYEVNWKISQVSLDN